MSPYLVQLFNNLIVFCTAIFLCFFTVQDRIIKPRWQIALASGLVTISYCLVFSAFPVYVMDIAVPFYLAIAFLYYRHTVDVPSMKLLFILMMTTNYVSFITSINVAFKIPQTAPVILITSTIITALSLPPVIFLFRGFLWPIIRDIGGREWRLLWIIPLTYSVMEVILVYAMSDVQALLHVFILCVSILSAFATYSITLFMLKQTAERTREVERMKAGEAYAILQAEQYTILAENIERTKATRHDLRHQLAVMKGFLATGDIDGAMLFCDELLENIPVTYEQPLCENFAVSAVALYYQTLARREGIDIFFQLSIPTKAGRIQDSDLCIIIGNFLENAVEACARMKPTDARKIKIRAQTRHDYLSIVMDNSFSGDYRVQDGLFESLKHSGEGIGLSSVRAVAQKYNGYAKFEAKGNVFLSSVVLQMRKGAFA